MDSFALQVKKEILNANYSFQDAVELISGIIATTFNGASAKDCCYLIKINNPELTNLIKDMLNQMKIKFSSDSINHNYISLDHFPYLRDLKNVKTLSWYFAGNFVGTGSISKLEASSYHLEMQFAYKLKALELKKCFNDLNFDFHLIQRRKWLVLYLKKSEQIGDFLKMIQAVNALMLFEEKRINRDYQNHLNRFSNLDAYNLQKMANANLEFEKLFKKVEHKNLIHLFSTKQLNFYYLKLKHRYITLSELANLYFDHYGVKISKSGLNHYLIKLKQIASSDI